MRVINEIIIHCSATKEGKDYTVLDIDRWHKERGFNKIGYHYVIYRDGSYHKGREESEIGAHCSGHNAHSIGICYIGGLDLQGKSKDTRTNALKKTLVTLVRLMKSRYPTITKVSGHNQYSNKDCPCFDVSKEEF